MRNLLDKTLKYYVIASVAVIVISAPVYYYFTEKLFKHEAKEVLILHKENFIKVNLPNLKLSEIAIWNSISRDSKIIDGPVLKKDKFFSERRMDSLNDEEVPFQVLMTNINVEGEHKIFMARVSMIEADALIENITRLFFFILVLLLTALYFLTRILSANLWKPFYDTVKKLEQFELESNTLPTLTKTNILEFERLNAASAKLLEKNLRVFKSQKEFIENAAHELQTPIALFLAKLDVLVQEITITKSLGDTLSSLQSSASRIIRLNRNLLLLSRLENDQFAGNDRVSVSTTVEKQAHFISEQLAEKQVNLSISVTAFEIITNETLLEIAVGNLLLNALRYNLESGVINVLLEDKMLTISNSGNAALEGDVLLFRRFSRLNGGNGSGLGLAIVKMICDRHGWTLSYFFSDGMHNFRIVF